MYVLKRVKVAAVMLTTLVAAYEPKNYKFASEWSQGVLACADYQVGVDALNNVLWEWVDHVARHYQDLHLGVPSWPNPRPAWADYKDQVLTFGRVVESERHVTGPQPLTAFFSIEEEEHQRGNTTIQVPQMKLRGSRATALDRIVWHKRRHTYSHFDMSTAPRYVEGLIQAMNTYLREHAGAAYVSLDAESGLSIFVNCDQEHVDARLASPPARDFLELGVGKNIWNLVLPYTADFGFKEALGVAFMLGGRSTLAAIEAMGLQSKEGYVRLATDPTLLDQLGLSERKAVTKSSFVYSEKKKAVKTKQTIFVEYQDQSKTQEHFCPNGAEGAAWAAKELSQNDIVLLPVTFETVVGVDITDNGDKLYPTMKLEGKVFYPELGQCGYVYNYKNLGMPAEAARGDVGFVKKDEEDFDDEDDEDLLAKITNAFQDRPDQRALQITSTQKLICGMVTTGNYKIEKFVGQMNDRFKAFIEYFNTVTSRFANDEETLANSTTYSSDCSSWGIEPWKVRMEKDRFVIGAKVKYNLTRDDWYCDHWLGERFKQHPGKMLDHPDTRSEVLEQLERWNVTKYYHLFDFVAEYDYFDVTGTSPAHMWAVLMHHVADYYPRKQHCEKNHPEFNSMICSFVYAYLRHYDHFDKIIHDRIAKGYVTPDYISYWKKKEVDTRNVFEKWVDTNKYYQSFQSWDSMSQNQSKAVLEKDEL